MDDLNLNSKDLLMIGDDLINDIQAAQKCGIFSILVKTGKYREEIVKNSVIKPDLILNSISDMQNGIT